MSNKLPNYPLRRAVAATGLAVGLALTANAGNNMLENARQGSCEIPVKPGDTLDSISGQLRAAGDDVHSVGGIVDETGTPVDRRTRESTSDGSIVLRPGDRVIAQDVGTKACNTVLEGVADVDRLIDNIESSPTPSVVTTPLPETHLEPRPEELREAQIETQLESVFNQTPPQIRP